MRRRRRCRFACAVHGGGGRLWAAPGRRPITTHRRFPLPRHDDNQSLFFSFFALPLLFLFTPPRRRHRHTIRAILRFLLRLSVAGAIIILFLNFFFRANPNNSTLSCPVVLRMWVYAKTRCYRAIRKCCRRQRGIVSGRRRRRRTRGTRERSRGFRLHEIRDSNFFPASIIRTKFQDNSLKTKNSNRRSRFTYDECQEYYEILSFSMPTAPS